MFILIGHLIYRTVLGVDKTHAEYTYSTRLFIWECIIIEMLLL